MARACTLLLVLTRVPAAIPKQQAGPVSHLAQLQSLVRLEGAERHPYLAACLNDSVVHGHTNRQANNGAGGSPYRQSDKCTRHSYHLGYERYLTSLAHSPRRVKILEIGLGCRQANVGSGVRLMSQLFQASLHPLELHVMEYNSLCLSFWRDNWATAFTSLNLTLFRGDQQSMNDLQRFASQTGGGYDAIIDDGGHAMSHHQNSLRVLFPLLKPGGWYAIEDLETASWPEFNKGSLAGVDNLTTTQLLGLMTQYLHGVTPSSRILTAFGTILPLISHIDCFPELCFLGRHDTFSASLPTTAPSPPPPLPPQQPASSPRQHRQCGAAQPGGFIPSEEGRSGSRSSCG